MTNQPQTIVAAPGKVLLSGGYIVLDSRFSGLVLGLDAYFEVQVTRKPCDQLSITVESPQFQDGSWKYQWNKNGSFTETTGRNPFVKTALDITFGYILEQGKIQTGDVLIKIFADNDFYSQNQYLKNQGLSMTVESLLSIPKYNSTGTIISKVNKTGLGSSAAMVTSLVGALLVHFGVTNSSKLLQKDIELIEKIAHIVHCLAQGKIGSGFDVSAACHGNHIYKRFSPHILASILEQTTTELIVQAVNSSWDHQVKTFDFPTGFQLQMGEISGGSNTPKMVSKLLQWREENYSQCEDYWNRLDSLQAQLSDLFQQISLVEKNSEKYQKDLKECSKVVIADMDPALSELATFLVEMHSVYKKYRTILKEMGEKCQVSIEPDEQSARLEQCMTIPGVIFGGVPGAGGYDALFCVVLGEIAKAKLLELWQTINITPLLACQSKNGIHIRQNK